ncbi:hypothetical protein JTE90_023522 [Oedothorax gibbosus]|uniref:Mesoderm induction early response protein 1 n=1 Tax=Oedothorax gibbosus TaxID=931172 RepID=A0AAV6VQH5_9ARAC|nr:hypothetical protein JTE90_023522 [Oedothorax gibbosus]
MFWKLCGIRIPDEDEYNFNKGKKSTIRVGKAFQASVPDSPNALDEKKLGEDKLLWDPSILPEEMIEHYLKSIECRNGSEEERALWLLHRCSYNVEEAIMRHRCMIQSISQLDTWTEYEQDCFVKGVHKYGKNFNSVQKVIRSKSVEEVVDYYYARKVKIMQEKSESMKTKKCIS